MFLVKLSVLINNTLIREIAFKKGLNFIIDKAANKDTESGNSVGKTTVLRVLDFCFGSDGSDIYKDLEFKTINQPIYDLINNKDVKFVVYLNDDQNKNIVIERTLSRTNKAIDFYGRINDIDFKNLKEFQVYLKKIVFFSNDHKPTLRQIMPKFIRSSSDKMTNTLNYLYKTTTKAEYECLFLFLFGFQDSTLFNDKLKLLQKIKKLQDELKFFRKPYNENTLSHMLAIVEKDIDKSQEKITNFKVSEAYTDTLTELKELKANISSRYLAISNLELKLSLNQATIQELQKGLFETDPQILKQIYNEAKSYIPTLQKTFEETVSFHNTMISHKIGFIEKHIVSLETDIKIAKRNLDAELQKEEKILRKLSGSGSLDDYNLLQDDIRKLYELKGKHEQILSIINDMKLKLEDHYTNLTKTTESINLYKEDFDNKLKIFNTFFSDYSKKLYNESYILTYNIDKDKFIFFIANTESNVGSGKKKAQIAAFDLAYISFIQAMKMHSLNFVMHDSLEDIHQNQLRTLFDIVSNIDGQYIVAVLKDKLSYLGDDFIKENTVLELDENNKFFNV